MRTPHNESVSPTDIANERGAGGRKGHTPERKCILSGKHDARDTLIRLAIGPDGQVAPDVRAKAPGRGAWIGVSKAELVAAQAKGKLRGALARAFKGAALTIPDSLADDIESQLRRLTLDRLGLEARAGNLITGAEKVDGACRSGQVDLLLHAADASEDGRRKRDQSWRVGREAEGSGLEGIILPVDRGPLSMALGKDNAVHVAIINRDAAKRISSALTRWQYYTGCETGESTDSGDAVSSALNPARD